MHVIALNAGSLIRVYGSPSISTVLTTTGRLVDSAQRRIQETGAWLTRVMLPGCLRVGRPGYAATLQVRMLHAHMRRLALNRGYDASADGSPTNQVDLGRTWTDFTLTAYTAEAILGFGLSSREQADLYRYRWYVAHLLGIDERLVRGIAGNEAAARLDAVFQTVTGPATEDSAVLADATLESATSALHGLLHVPREPARPALNAIARRIHGDAVCQDLRIPPPARRRLAGPVLSGLALARDRRRRDPQRWQAAIDRNLAAALDLAARPARPTAYQRVATGSAD
ncbi:oxygenase MpaB family protein [Nocardiopsis sp. CC223A]|uniref:oxygenase MpaB family protein n=1 Tax=Nocardiopsis sp. CC223A TaxID=3044051 RepID=UPI00278C56B3|nr:oxygenase MpaB family protein [Nocardiopsis sp. CC223A]